jgi:hypothetical protein
MEAGIFGSDATEPMRQVMRPGIYRPPVPVGGDLLKFRRVLI